jgi:hypothetical protein
LLVLFPTGNGNRGFAATTDTGARPTNPSISTSEMSYGFPTAAELFVRVLTEEGVRQVGALEQGQLTGRPWWEIARTHSVVLTRRIALEGAP